MEDGKTEATNGAVSPTGRRGRILRLISHDGWKFVGVLIAGSGLAYAWLHHPQKALVWGVLSRRPLVSVRGNDNRKLKVSFDGRPISDLNFVLLTVRNSGNVEVTPVAFDRPVSFTFEGKVLSAELTGTSPRKVPATVSAAKSSVTLAPLLLNKGEAVTIKVLVAGPVDSIEPFARIVGAEFTQIDLERRPGDSPVASVLRNLAFVLLVYLLVLSSLYSMQRKALRRNASEAQLDMQAELSSIRVELGKVEQMKLEELDQLRQMANAALDLAREKEAELEKMRRERSDPFTPPAGPPVAPRSVVVMGSIGPEEAVI